MYYSKISYFAAISVFLFILPVFLPGIARASSLSGFGDINDDCIVNSLDWSLMGAKWLTSDAASDLNNDGIVNSLDWSNMSLNWLKTCTDTPPPPLPSAELVPPIPSDFFAIGDRARVAPDPVNVFSAPISTSTLLGIQPLTSMGTVASGPVYTNGSWWWQINFDSGADGWAEEYVLTRLSAVAPASGALSSVLVSLKIDPPWTDESGLTSAQITAQRSAIASVENKLISDLGSRIYAVTAKLDTVPSVSLNVDASALSFLTTLDYVYLINQNEYMRDDAIGAVSTGTGISRGSVLGASTGTGSGAVIVIIDSGIDATHPAFTSGQIIQAAGACFSEDGNCSNHGTEMFGAGAGDPCDVNIVSNCYHGTSVAGVAAGSGGVAPGAQIISIRVGGITGNPLACRGFSSCRGFTKSDIYRALNYVYKTLRPSYNIAAVNISSVGQVLYRNKCDDYFADEKKLIDQLRSAGIATVAASGNDGKTGSMGSPACISSAVSVGGASAQGSALYSLSNSNHLLSLIAPGENITVPAKTGGIQGYAVRDGTSLAAPYVSGAFALLKQAAPGVSVKSKLATLQNTSVPIKDKRNADTLKQFIQCGVNLAKAEQKVNETFTLLDVPGVDEAWAQDINKCGQVVIRAEIYNFDSNGQSYQGRLFSNGEVTTIPCPGTCSWPDQIWPMGINDLGTITGAIPYGFMEGGSVGFQGFIKSDVSEEHFLQNRSTFPVDINNFNTTVGFKIIDSSTIENFIRMANGLVAKLPIVIGPGTYANGSGINDNYQVVASVPGSPAGYNNNSGQIWHFGTRGPIRNPGAAANSFLTGINNILDNPDRPPTLYNTGEMVGCEGYFYAKGVFKTVNYPGATWTCLNGLNDAGYAVGGYWAGNVQRSFMVNLNLLP